MNWPTNASPINRLRPALAAFAALRLTLRHSPLNCQPVKTMKRKPSLLVIFLSVFIDLVGFGIVLPLLPGFAEDDFHPGFSAKGLIIGCIIGSFSAMQFFFAPAWGRLSDRIGRRPVMLISNLGAAGSYSLFAIASGKYSANLTF